MYENNYYANHAQKLSWHELPFHEFIKLLNWLKDVSFLKWSGSSFQVVEAYYLKDTGSYRYWGLSLLSLDVRTLIIPLVSLNPFL